MMCSAAQRGCLTQGQGREDSHVPSPEPLASVDKFFPPSFCHSARTYSRKQMRGVGEEPRGSETSGAAEDRAVCEPELGAGLCGHPQDVAVMSRWGPGRHAWDEFIATHCWRKCPETDPDSFVVWV